MEIYADVEAALEAALGYLNFSAGASDPKFLTSLNALYRDVCTTAVDHGKSSQAGSPWNALRGRLYQKLDDLESNSAAFADVSQTRLVVAATHDQILPAYLAHHRELLFHQTDNDALPICFSQTSTETSRERFLPRDSTPRLRLFLRYIFTVNARKYWEINPNAPTTGGRIAEKTQKIDGNKACTSFVVRFHAWCPPFLSF
ncbi:MAG: hypothetical protein VB876_01780, partial [Pirellulales bacterium]